MSEPICYIPTKGVDDVIAIKLGWNPTTKQGSFNPYRIATLRGMYDETHKEKLNTDNIEEAVKQLISYRKEIAKDNATLMKSAGTNLSSSYKKLKTSFTATERFNRVNMITAMVSEVLDQIQAANKNLGRSMILEGFTANGRRVGGQFAVFEIVYDRLMDRQAQYMALPDGKGEEQAKAIRDVLENWSALTAFARMRLRDTEGLKLGNDIEYVDEANLDNYGDNVIADLYDMSESKRESWQETSDMQSAFGSVGQQVRRLIGSIPQFEEVNGKIAPKRDDLGFPIMLDPVKVHQQLVEMLRGITSESQMMGKLIDPKTGQPKQVWLTPVIAALRKNPQLRTQFFVDFKKNFQPYSIIFEDKETSKGGIKRYKTKLLNRVEDLLGGAFTTRIAMGQQLSDASVYDKSGKVNWRNLQRARQMVLDWLQEPENKQAGVFAEQKTYKVPTAAKFYQRGGSQLDRRNFLVQASRAFGVDLDADAADRIMRNPKDLRNYTRNLLELVTRGTDAALNQDELVTLANGGELGSRTYKSLVKAKNNKGNMREKITKLNTLITKNREGLRLESRVRHKDRKGNNISLFSNVNPSYLGDKLERIGSFVEANDKQGLKTFLRNEYLGSSFFYDNGTILNKWIEELWNACDSKEPLSETFAAQFTYQRFLGTEDNSFENFTSKQHAIDMLTEFFSDKQQNRPGTALYPVFILGDSGVSKYIRAKRYEAKDILDGLYNVYRQERRRQALVRATNKWLEEEGKRNTGSPYKRIDNFSDSADTFSTLQFLNPDYVAPDGTVGKYALSENPTEAEVKKAIQSYMSDAVAKFKGQLSDLGLLETKKVRKMDDHNNPIEVEEYVHLSQEATPATIDKVLADFYWNTKFATIQQLQMMTIDPSFYSGTKDLQKRYKEIHAPGSLLSVQALDFDGQLYSADGIERCLYFDDININAEVSNPEFMKAIEANFGKTSKVYKAYLQNTLTDGQGYRTLRSYRKVMGMAGKWTREMENVYKEIESIKARYGNSEIPQAEIARIASMAMVFQPIKPYMFTHEQIAVNGTDKQLIPVQHKYAEAVLIPELLPHGSKLRDIAYYMDENNIDLVGSTKIVKVGAFGSTDISNADNADDLRSALSMGYVHQLPYVDYRIQTNVPEHINSSQLFGTQVRKLIMAGTIKYDELGRLIEDYHYESYVGGNKVNLGGKRGKVRLNGRNLVAFYNSLIVANILQSFDKFEDNVTDIESLSNRLLQSTINNSRESMDNMLAYGLENGEFALPLFEGGLEHDSSSMLLSIFKKMVNKQAIKGGSAVQASAMGIKGYERDGDLKYVTDGNDNILYAECEIPWDLSYTDAEGNQVALEFDTYCNPDGTLKMKGDTSLLESEFPGITSMIAYRIPTERDYSMINLRVKRFSQKTAGGTIKVPAQGTTIAGFDFDVDKLYFMRREYKQRENQSDRLATAIMGMFDHSDLASDIAGVKRFEEYDFDKSPLENTRAARNNMLIELIQQRLMDKETFAQRYTPGGFANASRAARILREILFGSTDGIIKDGNVDFEALNRRADDKASDPEPNYDPSDPMTIITYNQQNQVAGKLIGIFANQNTNHAFASLMKRFMLKTPIEFAGHTADDGYGYDLLHAPKGVDVDLNVAEFLAASVDAVKDPVLNFLNLNTVTADAGAILARVGYNTQEIGLLFNQSIIKEVCDYVFNNNSDVNTAILELTEKYLGKGAKLPVGSSNDFESGQLAKNLLNGRALGVKAMENDTYKMQQMKILKLFSDIVTVANDVSQFVTSSKFTASNAVGSTFGDLYAQQMKVSSYLRKFTPNEKGETSLEVEMEVTDFPVSVDTPINKGGEQLDMTDSDYMDFVVDNPFAYEQAMYDMNRKALRTLMKYFPYDTRVYSGARNTMASLTKSGTLDADTINSVHSDLMVYMLSREERSEFNGELTKNTSHGAMTTREYYTKWFARDLFDHLQANPELKNMPIFQYMMFDVNEEDDTVSMNIQGIGGLAPYQKDAIRDSWAELDPRIAKDLFLYNFYKLGFTFSPLAFMNLAPTEVKQAITVPTEGNESRTYVDFLKEVQGDSHTTDYDDFAVQYILNHLDNKRLVFEAKSKIARDILIPLAYNAGAARSMFTLDISNLDKEKAKMFLLRKESGGIYYFRPVIKIGEDVFVAQGSTGGSFNASTNGTIKYVKMESQGTKNKSMQYHGEYHESLTNTATPDNFEEGSSSLESGVEEGGTPSFDRAEAVQKLAEEFAPAWEAAGIVDEQGQPYSVNSIVEYMNNDPQFTDNALAGLVEDLKSACRKDGVLMLDSEGNMLKGC